MDNGIFGHLLPASVKLCSGVMNWSSFWVQAFWLVLQWCVNHLLFAIQSWIFIMSNCPCVSNLIIAMPIQKDKTNVAENLPTCYCADWAGMYHIPALFRLMLITCLNYKTLLLWLVSPLEFVRMVAFYNGTVLLLFFSILTRHLCTTMHCCKTKKVHEKNP